MPKPPPRAVLDSLTEEDRALLDKLLAEPPAFMDHPDLHRRGAEKALFGAVAKFTGPRSRRFEAPQPVVVRSAAGGSAIPTLTAAQERALFLRMNYARMQVNCMLEERAGKRLSATVARRLLAWHRRSLDVRAQIVRMNMPLVLAMAKRTRLNSLDFNELISEGNMALLRSVDKFDCNRGFKFSTYSCRAILKSFSRVAMRASRYRGRFPAEFDPALEADNYLEKKRHDLVEDCVDELKSILVSNVAELSEVERTVIVERFALAGPDREPASPKTLEQVGSIIGVTKERVRQIQNKALSKIRTALEEGYLAA
jgi:RNA polymerase sigma factor (sigma-70 family)